MQHLQKGFNNIRDAIKATASSSTKNIVVIVSRIYERFE